MTGSDPAVGEGATSVVLAWLHAIERHDLQRAGELSSADFVHTNGGARRPLGFSEWCDGHAPIWEALPDTRYNVHDLAADGEVVTGRFAITGTHTGHLRMPAVGISDIPPTGRAIRLPEEPFRSTVRDGRVTSMDVQVPPGGGLQAFLAQIGHPPVVLER